MHSLIHNHFHSQRWNVDDYYSPENTIEGTMYVRFGVFLDRIEDFDAAAFRLAANEALAMEPQSRILLEQTSLAVAEAKTDIGSLSSTFLVE